MSGARPAPNPGGTALGALLLAAVAAVGLVRLDRPLVAGAHGPDAARPWPDMRIDVNTAAAAELRLLPGVGPRLAERIVDDRAARGPFASIDALDRVRGIGPVRIDAARPCAVVDSPPPRERPAEEPGSRLLR